MKPFLVPGGTLVELPFTTKHGERKPYTHSSTFTQPLPKQTLELYTTWLMPPHIDKSDLIEH